VHLHFLLPLKAEGKERLVRNMGKKDLTGDAPQQKRLKKEEKKRRERGKKKKTPYARIRGHRRTFKKKGCLIIAGACMGKKQTAHFSGEETQMGESTDEGTPAFVICTERGDILNKKKERRDKGKRKEGFSGTEGEQFEPLLPMTKRGGGAVSFSEENGEIGGGERKPSRGAGRKGGGECGGEGERKGRYWGFSRGGFAGEKRMYIDNRGSSDKKKSR